MKFRLIVFIGIVLISSCSCGNEVLRYKVETLNTHSIELLGLSILELTKLHTLSAGEYFLPLEVLEGNGDLEILEKLEQKGYLTIEVVDDRIKKMIGYEFPLNKTDRRIKLSSKGRELLDVLLQASI